VDLEIRAVHQVLLDERVNYRGQHIRSRSGTNSSKRGITVLGVHWVLTLKYTEPLHGS
jgi:hypothetical protein